MNNNYPIIYLHPKKIPKQQRDLMPLRNSKTPHTSQKASEELFNFDQTEEYLEDEDDYLEIAIPIIRIPNHDPMKQKTSWKVFLRGNLTEIDLRRA